MLSAGVFIRRAALLLPASAFIRHAALAFGRRIYSPCPLAVPPSPFFRRRIPSPHHHCLLAVAFPLLRHHFLYRLAHPIATPRLLFLAGASPCRATIAYLGWRIPSLCLHRLSRSAHPIAALPYRISAGASHHRTSITYLLVCALTRYRTARRNIKVVTFFMPAPPPHQY